MARFASRSARMEQLHPSGPTAKVSTCTARCVALVGIPDASSALARFQVASPEMKRIILGDNAEVLPTLPAQFARLVYIDPPFNTGKVQRRDRIRVTATDRAGDRGGFGGRRYDVEKIESGSYADTFDHFEGFLIPRIKAA